MQALAMHTDTLKKQARNTLDLHVSLVKFAFLETAGELHFAPEVLAVLPDAYSKVARDASTVNKLRARIKKLKKALSIADGYDLSLINDQRSEHFKAVIDSLEIQMQLDLALFGLGKKRASQAASSAKQRTVARTSLYARVVKPLYGLCELRNSLGKMLMPQVPPLVVKDILSGTAKVRPTDDDFAERRAFRDSVYRHERLTNQVAADEQYMRNNLHVYCTLEDSLLAAIPVWKPRLQRR